MRWLHLTNTIKGSRRGRNRWRRVGRARLQARCCPGAWAALEGGPVPLWGGCAERASPADQRWRGRAECAGRPGGPAKYHPLAGQPAPHSAHGNSGKGRPFPPRISSLSSASPRIRRSTSNRASGPHHEPPSSHPQSRLPASAFPWNSTRHSTPTPCPAHPFRPHLLTCAFRSPFPVSRPLPLVSSPLLLSHLPLLRPSSSRLLRAVRPRSPGSKP